MYLICICKYVVVFIRIYAGLSVSVCPQVVDRWSKTEAARPAKAGDWGSGSGACYVCFTLSGPCLLYLFGEFRDMGPHVGIEYCASVCVFVSAAAPVGTTAG